MKISLPSTACALQSDSFTHGRRVMIFTGNVPPAAAKRPAIRRPSRFRLKLMMAPEAQFSFEPAVKFRSQA